MPRLPAELTDRVIDHLHTDRLTLATCSLVCKAWFPASRYHLFNIAGAGIHLKQSNVHSFVQLLDSPTTSTFFEHALNVSISGPILDVGDPRSAKNIFDTLSHHLFRLKIKSLSFKWIVWDIRDEKQEEELFRYFATIPILDLENVTFPGSPPQYDASRDQFLKFITSFSSLEVLHLRGIYIPSVHVDDDPTIPDLTLSPLLRSVYLAAHSLTWFLSAVQWPPLSFLTISHITREDMDAIQAVLHSLGPYLRDLTLGFAQPYFHPLFNLRQNINLLRLCIYDIGFDDGCANLVEMLSQMASFDLETIHLQVTFVFVEMVDWQQIAQVLTTRPQFAKLNKVQLDLKHYNSYNVDYICGRMSILGNILRVSVEFELV